MKPYTVILAAALVAAGAHAQSLVLYESDRFGGERVALDAASPDLGAQGFRNRTGSIVVGTGRWEVCTEPQFSGTCIVFSAGRYDVLPSGVAQRIASARPVTVTAADSSYYPVPMPSPGYGGGAALTLYEHAGQGGRSLQAGGAMPNLNDQGFNDIASSIEVRSGRWQLCANANYTAPCAVFGPGRYDLGGEMQDSVSSVRPVYGNNDQPLPAIGGVVLFENSDFSGRTLQLSEATRSLGRYDFNDRASAIEVLAGRWTLCADDDYRGSCTTFGPGRYTLSGPLQDGVSSLRPNFAR